MAHTLMNIILQKQETLDLHFLVWQEYLSIISCLSNCIETNSYQAKLDNMVSYCTQIFLNVPNFPINSRRVGHVTN